MTVAKKKMTTGTKIAWGIVLLLGSFAASIGSGSSATTDSNYNSSKVEDCVRQEYGTPGLTVAQIHAICANLQNVIDQQNNQKDTAINNEFGK